ncbi:DUF4388 domain-containing protein [Gemmatimonas sp.]|jgi:hypothetical protein|uniref:DUF4388 domain-containing protein n=1 Tax=Gemmatimonas sp. TaxID=1962908 RepID=UPI0022BABDF3|nr:DUF4388 domain-containing protein [Gemmatimonas sp.]MCZ8204601.1 DUF4388 domain-containing protein [Gemmatimonas sp.]
MALEGRLRDLALTEVLQLLALGRKTGVLHCDAPLQGRRAQLAFEAGAIVDAEVVGADRVHELAAPRRRESDRAAMEAAVQDVLLWRDGTFRFAPAQRPLHPSAVRLTVEPLLMDAAMRAEVWQHIEARVPHARVIPAFVEVEPHQLPLLRLTPPQWDILTRVDGQRDLMSLAAAMQRDVTDVALLVHDLLGAGLLTLREGQAAPRRNPTPPAMASIPTTAELPSAPPGSSPPTSTAAVPLPGPVAAELWVPSGSYTAIVGPAEPDEDSLFDPVAHGVLSTDGLPLAPAPWQGSGMTSAAVAPAPVEPSFPQEQPPDGAPVPTDGQIGHVLCQQGDALARTGDLRGAVAHWNAALRSPVPPPNADQVREAIGLAARLHALLHP